MVGFVAAIQQHLSRGQLSAAEKVVLAGIEKHPGQPQLLTLATNVFTQTGRPDATLLHAKRLIEECPGNWVGYVRAAQALVVLLRFQEAKDVLDERLKRGCKPAGKLHMAYGNLLLATREFLRAEEFFGLAGESAATEQERFAAAKLEKCSRILRGDNGGQNVPAPALSELRDLRDAIVFGAFRECAPRERVRGASPGEEAAAPSKGFLFVMGLGRSGTTGLGSMLNLSSKIEMYTELYPPHAYCADDFGLAQVKRALKPDARGAGNAAIMAKRRTSLMIGDKRPNLQFMLEPTYESLKGHTVTFVHIARDLASICMSTEKRVQNIHGRSPRDLGTEQMICLYNRTVQCYLDLHERHPEVLENVVFVDYSKVFGSIDGSERLFERLGIELLPEERLKLEGFMEESEQLISARSGTVPGDILKCIDKLLDHEAHERFRSLFYHQT